MQHLDFLRQAFVHHPADRTALIPDQFQPQPFSIFWLDAGDVCARDEDAPAGPDLAVDRLLVVVRKLRENRDRVPASVEFRHSVILRASRRTQRQRYAPV
jgi:hypothetical protein